MCVDECIFVEGVLLIIRRTYVYIYVKACMWIVFSAMHVPAMTVSTHHVM